MKRSLVLALAVVFPFGCGTQGVAPEPAVVSQFDPSLPVPVLPTPNDLALDGTTGLLTFDDAPDATPLEKQFNTYLRSLNGAPPSAVATTTFSGKLDPATVTDQTVLVFETTGGNISKLTEGVSFTYDGEVTLKVSYPWKSGHTYAVGLLGGNAGLKGLAGEKVVGTAAFDLLRVKYPLVTCSDLADPGCRSANAAIRGKTLEDERTKALKMERARLSLVPVITWFELNGTPREFLANLWSFRVATPAAVGPAVAFDPALKVIPFPHDVLVTNGKVDLPAEDGDDELATATKADLNQLDGFSTTAAIVTERSAIGAAGVRLDPATLKAEQFVLANLDTPAEVVGFDLKCNACAASAMDPDQVALVPNKPLHSHTRYAVLWLAGAKTATGEALTPAPVWPLVSGDAPLAVDGKSTVRSLDDASAVDFEKLRALTQTALGVAAARSIDKQSVLLAWVFTTQTTGPTLVPLHAKPKEWNLPTTVTGGPAALTTLDISLLAQISGLLGKDFSSQIRWAKEGKFTTGNAMDPAATELDLSDPANPVVVPTDGAFTAATLAAPRREQLTFLLFVPKTPKFVDGRIPVIVFQHGITRSRRDAATIANTIAKAGYATLAIDHPFHGNRTYCMSNGECLSGGCVEHRCPGGYRSSEQGFGTPDTSGLKWGSSTNLAATRDQIRQLVIDQAQLMRVLNDTTAGIGAIDVDDPATTAIVEKLEPANPGYIGMSLGSVVGSLVLAGVPEIAAATLNVGGGSPTDILANAQVAFLAQRKAHLDQYLDLHRGLKTGSQAYEDFYNLARWMLDPADGQNMAPHYIDAPLSENGVAFPKKRVFYSWVKNDPWVPNITTEYLIRATDHVSAPANFKQTLYTAGGNHSFMLDFQYAGVLQAQQDAVGWLDQP